MNPSKEANTQQKRSVSLCLDFQDSPLVIVTTRRGAFGWEWVESVGTRGRPGRAR